jgi:hypothetical protein
MRTIDYAEWLKKLSEKDLKLQCRNKISILPTLRGPDYAKVEKEVFLCNDECLRRGRPDIFDGANEEVKEERKQRAAREKQALDTLRKAGGT